MVLATLRSRSPRSVPRKLVAEWLGTLLLVATVVGSGIMGVNTSGNNTFQALLGNTLPTGAILFVLIGTLGPVSGAHFNPVVSLVFTLRRGWFSSSITPPMHPALTVAYVVVQCLGGVMGTWLAHGMFEQPVFQYSLRERFGPAQWLAEGTATFGLVFAILGSVRWNPKSVPAVVGLYITAAYWFTASTSFANPAVTLARSFTRTFSGIRPIDVGPFVVSQIVGALLALAIGAWLFPDDGDDDDDETDSSSSSSSSSSADDSTSGGDPDAVAVPLASAGASSSSSTRRRRRRRRPSTTTSSSSSSSSSEGA